MSEQPDESSNSPSTDPRLRRFLQRAVPIIAAERGINERSLIRIRAIADDLRLPNELYQSGLRKLKKIGVGQKLTRYEREFSRFLRKEFKHLSGHILTVAIEQKALEIATTKYQIPIERAREIIADRAIKQNIGRISRSEAELHVEQMISDRIRYTTFIDAETRQRFYSVGKEWGVDRDRVDSIVEQIIAQNRESRQAKTRSGIPLYAPFIGAALIALAVASYFIFFRGNPNSANQDGDAAKPIAEQYVFPDWWPEPTKVDAAKLQANSPDFKSILPYLINPDPTERLHGYGELVDYLLTLNQSGEEFGRSWLIFRDLANFEPEGTVRNSFAKLLGDLIIVDRLPNDASEAQKSFAANRLAFQFYQEVKPSSTIRIDIESLLEAKTGIRPDVNEYVELSRRSIANALWQQLEDAAWGDTEEAYRKLNWVATQSSIYLSEAEFQTKLSDTIYGILEASADHWQSQSAKKWLSVAINQSDRESLVRWIDLAQSTDNDQLSTWLKLLLAKRLEVKDGPNDHRKMIALLRKSATGIERREAQIALRWERWNEKLSAQISMRPITANSVITAQQISDVSHFATLAMLLTNDVDHQKIMAFDRLLEEGPLDLDSVPFFSGTGTVFRKTDSGPPRTWEITSKQDLVARIQSSSDVSDVGRANALKQLSRLSARIADIEPREAKIVAEYCLSVTDSDQLLVVQQSLSDMAIWLNLTLAFVDAIDTSKLERQELVALIETVIGEPIEIANEDRWRLELQQTLLEYIENSLVKTISRTKSTGGDSWNMLAASFHEQYRQRCFSLGIDSNLMRQARTTQHLQLLFANSLEHPDQTNEQRWKQVMLEWEALQNISSASLEQMVILEARVMERLIEQATMSDDEKKTLLAQFGRQSQGLPTLGQKLYYAQSFYCRIAQQRDQRRSGGGE